MKRVGFHPFLMEVVNMKVQKRPKLNNNQMEIRLVEFDPGKITSAIYRAAMAVGG